MRLGIVSEAFERGGAERQAAIWAGLAAAQGHEITGITLLPETTAPELPSMRRVLIPKASGADMAKIAWRLRGLQRELDALIAFEPFLAVCGAAAGLRIPWMAVTGKVPAQLRADSSMPRATYRWAFGRATLASAPTQGVIDAYRAAGIRPRKEWALIPNVAAAEAFEEKPQAGKGVLFVGRLVAVKDPLLAIEAAAAVPTPLTLLGEGEMQADVEAAIAARAGGVVTIRPFSGRPWGEYARHRVLLVSSRHESFGNVIVESLAAGTPVVSVDCDFGPREILAGARYSRLTERSPEALAAALSEVLARPYTEPERDECLAIAARYRPEAVAPLVTESLRRLEAEAWDDAGAGAPRQSS